MNGMGKGKLQLGYAETNITPLTPKKHKYLDRVYPFRRDEASRLVRFVTECVKNDSCCVK